MRTLELDDDVVERAERIAEREGISASEVIASLVRAFIPNGDDVRTINGVPIFAAPPGAPTITNEDIERWLDEDDADYALRCQLPGGPASQKPRP